jgi:hypothetical protein
MDMVRATIADPGFTEPGRLSRRVSWEADSSNDTPLHRFATHLGEAYLDHEPGIGSTAVVSTVTDGSVFARHTQDKKAASNWHQDFVTTERGFFFPPDNTTRLIIPTLSGPLYATGQVSFDEAIRVAAIDTSETIDREAALDAGRTVIGTDGVLIKATDDPVGGTIREAAPERIYVIPATSVHKANPVLPTGRIFFQLDAQW